MTNCITGKPHFYITPPKGQEECKTCGLLRSTIEQTELCKHNNKADTCETCELEYAVPKRKGLEHRMIENWEEEYDKKFYSDTDKTCTWHRNFDLKQFISKVYQQGKEEGKWHIRNTFTNKWLEDARKQLIKEIVAMLENKKDRSEHLSGKLMCEYWAAVLKARYL